MILFPENAVKKQSKQWQKNSAATLWLGLCQLTIFRHNSKSDNVSSILDELNNIVVWKLHDGAAVDSRNTVSHLHLTYTVCRAAFNNTTNFVRYNWKRANQRNDSLQCGMFMQLYEPNI